MERVPIIPEQVVNDVIVDYSIGKLIWAKELSYLLCPNTIILFKTTKGIFTLKGFHKKKQLLVDYEADIVTLLNRKNVGVQTLVKNNNGSFHVVRNNFVYLIYFGIDGEHVTYIDTRIAREFGKYTALLHSALETYRGRRVIPRIDEVFKKHRNVPTAVFGFPLKKEYDLIFKNFHKEVKTIRLRRQVIHAGISVSHTFLRKKKFLAFIDWDYAHVGYTVYDLAIFIADVLMIKPEIIPVYVSAYREIHPLDDDEKKALYFLIEFRLLSNSIMFHNFQGTKAEHKKGRVITKAMISGYKYLDRLTLQGFLNLIDKKTSKNGKILITDGDLIKIGAKPTSHYGEG
jgi:Ser/Thr protein kinase RdoA (MazF antagonist)